MVSIQWSTVKKIHLCQKRIYKKQTFIFYNIYNRLEIMEELFHYSLLRFNHQINSKVIFIQYYLYLMLQSKLSSSNLICDIKN